MNQIIDFLCFAVLVKGARSAEKLAADVIEFSIQLFEDDIKINRNLSAFGAEDILKKSEKGLLRNFCQSENTVYCNI